MIDGEQRAQTHRPMVAGQFAQRLLRKTRTLLLDTATPFTAAPAVFIAVV